MVADDLYRVGGGDQLGAVLSDSAADAGETSMITAADIIWITLIDKRLAWLRELSRQRQDNAVRIGLHGRNLAPNVGGQALALHDDGVLGEGATMIYLSPVTWNLMDMVRADF